MNKKILTFELNEEKEKLEIHGDTEGLTLLIKKLQNLLYQSKQDHIHLTSSLWGGEELTDEVQGEHNKLINEVKVFLWK